VRFDRCLFGPPHRNFWIGHRTYSSNEHGEIELDPDTSHAVIEELERHGYRSRR